VLFSANLHKYLVDIEGIAVALVHTFQSSGEFWAEFDAPEAHSFITDYYPSLSEKILYISMAEVESVVQPDRVLNAFRGNQWRLYKFIPELSDIES